MTEIPTLDERLVALASRLRSHVDGAGTDAEADRAMTEAAAALEILASAGAAGPLVERDPSLSRDVMRRELAEALGSPSSEERWEALLDSVEALASDTTVSDRLAELAGALDSHATEGADWDELIARVRWQREERPVWLAFQDELIGVLGLGDGGTRYAPGHELMETEELRAEVNAVLARTLKELHNERAVSKGLGEHVRSLNTALGVAPWSGVRAGERAIEGLRELHRVARQRIDAAAALHVAMAPGEDCYSCDSEKHPCPTRRALDPDEGDEDPDNEAGRIW